MTEAEIKDFLSLFPDNLMVLTPKEQRVSLLLYQLLAKGRPVTLHDLANESGIGLAEIDEIISGWGSEVLWDKDKNINGFFGLSLSQTAHAIEVDNQTLYTWCAWDTLFIPQLLNKNAIVKSRCPVSKQEIELKLSPTAIESIDPKSTVVSLIKPDPSKISENVIGTFCCHIHFFSSPEFGNKWSEKNNGTYIVSVDHAYQLGRRKNELRYSNVFTST